MPALQFILGRRGLQVYEEGLPTQETRRRTRVGVAAHAGWDLVALNEHIYFWDLTRWQSQNKPKARRESQSSKANATHDSERVACRENNLPRHTPFGGVTLTWMKLNEKKLKIDD